MTYNKEEVEKNMRNNKCWMCRRTEEESLSDFKKLILDNDDKVDKVDNDTIISSDIDNIKNIDTIVFPKGIDWDSVTLMGIGAFNKETGKDVEIKSDHNVSIYICPVCDTILTEIWQSAQDNAIETLNDKFNKKIVNAACALMEDYDYEEQEILKGGNDGPTNNTNSHSTGTC